jgi:hypothetical protein
VSADERGSVRAGEEMAADIAEPVAMSEKPDVFEKST